MCAWRDSFLPCLRTVPGLREYPEMGSPEQSRPARAAPPACEPIGAEGENWACITPPTRVTMPPRRLSMESIAIPVKSSNQPNNVHRDENHAKQTDFNAHRQCRGP